MTFAFISTVDPRIAQSGLTWRHAGIFYVTYAILDFVLAPVTAFIGRSLPLSFDITVATAVFALVNALWWALIVLAALIVAVWDIPDWLSKTRALGLRRTRWHWYFVSFFTAFVFISALLLFAPPNFTWFRISQEIGGKIGSGNAEALYTVAATIVSVLVGELIARGLVLQVLLRHLPFLWAVGGATLFALAQLPSNFFAAKSSVGNLVAFAAGQLVFCFIAARSGSILPTMLSSSLIAFVLALTVIGP